MAPPPGCRAACVLVVSFKTPHHFHATGTPMALPSNDVWSPLGSSLLGSCPRGTCRALDPFVDRDVSFHVEKRRRGCARRWATRTLLSKGREADAPQQRERIT